MGQSCQCATQHRRADTAMFGGGIVFDAWIGAPPLPDRVLRTAQLIPVLGPGPNTDPGLAGETGVSGD